MSVVHRVQGFDKATEALRHEYVIPAHLVGAVRKVVGVTDDLDDEPGVIPLTAENTWHVAALTGLALDADRYDWFLEPSEAEFAMGVDWPDVETGAARDVEGLSFGCLKVSVSGTEVTAWRAIDGLEGSGVEFPLYRLAEWIARNWWALLYEPRKGEAYEADDYRQRHWLGTVGEGLALPDLWIASDGGRALIEVRRSNFRAGNLAFINKAECSIERDVLKDQLSGFVEAVLGRISASGIDGSWAQELWDLVCATPRDQEPYCRLVGAMGLSPYADNGTVNDILTSALDRYDQALVLDICQVADVNSLGRVADLVNHLANALSRSNIVDLSAIRQLTMPPDIAAVPWQRGVDAARQVRNHLGVSSRDTLGADAIFDRLHVDTGPTILLPGTFEDEGRISAALKRTADPEMRVALVGGSDAQRRFAAARAVFLGMLEGQGGSRLITAARTRDQQASRAFAAETIAPIDYIRGRAGYRNTISNDLIGEIANDLSTTATVVRHQAINNRMRVA